MNHRAMQWAYDQRGLPATAKDVLITFAMHADERGYSFPGVSHIASVWGHDETTVRRQIRLLLVRGKLRATRRRVGITRQGKVYRMPKSAYARREQCLALKDTKGGRKAGERRALCLRNDVMMETNPSSELMTRDSLQFRGENGSAERPSRFLGKERHQHQPKPKPQHTPPHSTRAIQDHLKWPEYCAWCRSQRGQPYKTRTDKLRLRDGRPTAKGFETWLSKQAPQWRGKVRQDLEAEGYELDGQFLTADEANQRALKNPDLIEKMRPAIKRDGRIILQRKPAL